MSLSELLAWWNLVFELPFLFALVYILVLALTGLGAEAGGHDASFEHDVGDVGHDISADQDVAADHDAGVEHTHEMPGQNDEESVILKALSFLGVGRVPLSIVVMVFCLVWGFAGWASNMLLNPVLPAFLFFWPSLAIAVVASVGLTKAVSSVLKKIMPSTETYSTEDQDFIGKRAIALYPIDEKSGTARLRDRYGYILDVQCRTEPGEASIPADCPIVLIRYTKEERTFIARVDPLKDKLLDSGDAE